jgi:hypothetical protein
MWTGPVMKVQVSFHNQNICLSCRLLLVNFKMGYISLEVILVSTRGRASMVLKTKKYNLQLVVLMSPGRFISRPMKKKCSVVGFTSLRNNNYYYY